MTLKHGRQAYAAVNIDGYWIFSSLPPPARPHRSWSPNRTKRRNACNIARYSAYRIVNFRISLDEQDVILCDHRLSSANSGQLNIFNRAVAFTIFPCKNNHLILSQEKQWHWKPSHQRRTTLTLS